MAARINLKLLNDFFTKIGAKRTRSRILQVHGLT